MILVVMPTQFNLIILLVSLIELPEPGHDQVKTDHPENSENEQ